MTNQTTLPGTEPITTAQLAQRRAAQPLRPSAPQAPCDVGLFGDTAAQSDLVDRARAETFTVKLAYMGRSLPDTFSSLVVARKAAERTGFTCWISDAHGIVGEWSPIGGWDCRRMTRNGELFHFTDRGRP